MLGKESREISLASFLYPTQIIIGHLSPYLLL